MIMKDPFKVIKSFIEVIIYLPYKLKYNTILSKLLGLNVIVLHQTDSASTKIVLNNQ